jgi:hypothetical protein
MKKLLFLLVLMFLALNARAQTGAYNSIVTGLQYVSSLPATCTPGVTASVQLSTGAFTVNYCSGVNTWTALGASGAGSTTGTTGQSAFFNGLNQVGGGTVVLEMAGVAGADLGAKMNNCATALPATGGTCRGDNLSGALTLSTAVTTAKAVTYTFCGQQISQTAAVTLTANFSGIIGCNNSNTILTKAASIDQITLTGTNNFVQGMQLVGVSGSFTGSGVVISVAASKGDVEFNYITGEASQAVKNSSQSALIFDNTLSGSTAAAVVTSAGGIVSTNTVIATGGDGIDVSANDYTVVNNSIQITPASAVAFACGVNAIGDQIGGRISDNQIQLSDTHAGDILGGDCDSPTGTHNLNMVFHGDDTVGLLSGGALGYGFIMNNAAGLNTNWTVTVEAIGCVHLTFCIKRTDAQNNKTLYLNIQPGDVGLDNGTGSTADVWVVDMPYLNFANLPTPAGVGSQVYCTDCIIAKVVNAGSSSGGYVFREIPQGGAQTWTSHQTRFYFSGIYSNATTTASNITGLAVPVGASMQYGITCTLFYQGSAATAGLDITITAPAGAFFSMMNYTEFSGVAAPVTTSTSTFGTKLIGNTTVTTGINVANVTLGLSNGVTAGTVQLQGSATGAGTVTVYQNSFCSAI